MPNWCENDLKIKGTSEDIDKLVTFVKGTNTDFDFNKIIPMPSALENVHKGGTHIGKNYYTHWREDPLVGIEQEELDRLKAEYGAVDWYDWSIANWGTKWNLGNNVDIKFNDNYVEYHFPTAWSPPIPVICALAEQFPRLKFSLKYYECGCAFKGYVKYKNGILIEEGSGSYSGKRGG